MNARDQRLAEALLTESLTASLRSMMDDTTPISHPMERIMAVYVAGLDHGMKVATTDIASARCLQDFIRRMVDAAGGSESTDRDLDSPVRRLLRAIET